MKNKPIIRIVIIMLSCLLSTLSIAQTTLKGKVLDQKTKAPIPYASVFVENTFTGIATAEDGSFSFEIEEGHQGDVIIRAMGYDTKVVKQSEFIPQGLDIYLMPASFSIQEVEATAKKALTDPDQIVRKAIKRIPENMASDYTVLEGTYHQAFQDYETDKLLDAKQVKVKVGLQGIETENKTDSIWHDEPLSDNVFWESFRYNDDALLPQYQIPDYGTDHLQCLLRMDPVRNFQTPTFDFVKRLDEDFVENHYFHLDQIGVYNGENVYQIRIYLLNNIRFSKVNPIDDKYAFSEAKIRINPRNKIPGVWHPNYMYLKQSLIDEHAVVPIGRLMINTQDLAIVYFEYINGFGNNRYKFSAEYVKNKEKYYPSKLYFSNKLIMSKHPDFDVKGADVESGLKCLMDKRYYSETVKKYSKTKENKKDVKDIIKKFTITCYKSAYTKNFGEFFTAANPRERIYVHSVVARSRIVEEIQNTFQYGDFQKLLHHRYVEFKINPNDSIEYNSKSDFYLLYYPLGARAYHWNSDRIKDRCFIKHPFVYNITGDTYYFIPIPFTSADEYRHVWGAAKDSTLYDKNDLIKGRVGIKGKGDGVYNERYRSKLAEGNVW